MSNKITIRTQLQLGNRALISIACIFAAIAALFIFVLSSASASLLPASTRHIPLQVEAVTDEVQGGDSSMILVENDRQLRFDFTLSHDYEPPYANLNLMFEDKNSDGTFIDLSMYSHATINIRCTPRNELAFMLHVYEDKVTNLDEINSFRKVSSFFTCDEVWQEIQIDLNRLVTPEWWLQARGLSLSNQQYSLQKVKGISLTNTAQSPRNVKTSVFIEGMTLKGFRLLWLITGSMVLLVVFVTLIMYSRRKLPSVSEENTQLSEPQLQHQLDIKSKRERETDSLIDYLASNYSNAQISLEHTAEVLGLNRTKINDILKEKTGHTFSTYLNKLRLTEAARLLKEKHISVSEAAFVVGFGSISYFNRVFKKEFGCPPSKFRDNDESAT